MQLPRSVTEQSGVSAAGAAAASRGSRKCELIRESVVLVFFRKLALIEF